MSALLTKTAKSARTGKGILTLLGVFAALAATSLVVYAATARPDFKLGASPTSRTINQGQAAIYNLTVKRVHKFKGAVKLSIKGMPRGASATWKQTNGKKLATKKGVATLPASKKAAVLLIQTAAGTPTGNSSPKVTAKGGKRSHTKTLKLRVNPAVLPGPPSTPGAPGDDTGMGTGTGTGTTTPVSGTIAVGASSPQTVVASDSVDVPVTITRGGGFGGDVAMTVTGLPAGATSSFTPTTVGSSDSTSTLKIDSGTAAPGDYTLSITGTGSDGGTAVSGSKSITLTIQPKQDFTITSDPVSGLSPGNSAPLHLSLSNPYSFDLKITGLTVSVASTDKAGCPAGTNYSVTQLPASDFPSGNEPVLPAGQTKKLSDLGITDSPAVQMIETNTNQDACQGAALTFDYTGTATK